MIKKYIPIVIILVLVIVGGYYSINQLMPGVDEDGAGKTTYSTSPAFRGDINVGVNTSGQLNASYGGGIRVPQITDPEFGGVSFTIAEFIAKEGDSLKMGDPVIRLTSTDLDNRITDLRSSLESKRDYLAQLLGINVRNVESVNPYDGIVIISPIAGRVTELSAVEGEELGSLIANIINDSEFKMSFKARENEYPTLYAGQRILLKFPYFEGYYEGFIESLNPNPVPDDTGEFGLSYVHWGVIKAKNPGLIQTNMTASVSTATSATSNLPETTLVTPGRVTGYVNERRIYKNAISSEELIVTDVLVNERDYVTAGQAIVRLAGAEVRLMIQSRLDEINNIRRTIQKAEELRNNLVVTAPMDGVVAGFWRTQGEVIMPGEWVGDIFNTGNMMIWTQVDDIDVVYIRQDAPVVVTVDALPGEVFEGRVTRVSQSGQDSSGIIKYSVEIGVSGSGALRPGMLAQCFIDAGESLGTLLIPIEAVFEENGMPKVEVLKEDETVVAVAIKTGLINYRYAEVLSGLEEGDLVITGSSSDLLPSQHIKSSDSILPNN
jgi:multidrug efflux pump subunit AcrA (membrane-fusion protein)